jgi:hypothetical protein
MKNELTENQQKELQKLSDDMMGDVKDVVQDYEENPSEISGSVVEVNENSPYLQEEFEGDSWKKVIKGSVEEAIGFIKTQKEANVETSIDEAQILKNIQEKERLDKFERVIEDRIVDEDGHTINKTKQGKDTTASHDNKSNTGVERKRTLPTTKNQKDAGKPRKVEKKQTKHSTGTKKKGNRKDLVKNTKLEEKSERKKRGFFGGK